MNDKNEKQCVNRTQRQQKAALIGALTQHCENKYKTNHYWLKWKLLSLCLKQATVGDKTIWSGSDLVILQLTYCCLHQQWCHMMQTSFDFEQNIINTVIDHWHNHRR